VAGDDSVEWVLASLKRKKPVFWNMTDPMDHQMSDSTRFFLSNLRIEMKRKSDTGLPEDAADHKAESIWSLFQHSEGTRIYGR